MKIQNINTTTFGSLSTRLLSPEHRMFIGPIYNKLSNIGEHVSLFAASSMRPVGKGGYYTFFSDCIEFIAKKQRNGALPGNTGRSVVFTDQYVGKSAAKQNIGLEEILSAAFKAAKDALKPLNINA